MLLVEPGGFICRHFFSIVFNVRRWMRAVLCTVSCLRLIDSKDILALSSYKLDIWSKLWRGSERLGL
ncbi:hypothetical protein J3E69DRAFT_340318 [Trichoderma sp. SZMC 28015]